jgi:hypothetical protein
MVKKNKHYMEWDGVRYEVDTPYDELVWEELKRDRDGHFHHKVWGYSKDTVVCPSCGRSEYMKYNIQNTGVMSKCEFCSITTKCPPFDVEENRDIAEMLKDEVISTSKAYEISLRIGQELPPNLQVERRKESHFKKKQ